MTSPRSEKETSDGTGSRWTRAFPEAFILTSASLGLIWFYKTWMRRIPQAANVKPGYFRHRSIYGRVTSVGDADGLRIYHTPGGKLLGWGWLRSIPSKPKDLKDNTISIRLAGVDAPELAHFGRPAQPFGEEAQTWLKSYVLNKNVRAYVHRRDQYERIVATVYIWKWFLNRDVGMQMLKRGLAVVYEGKTGAEFGGSEEKYHRTESLAKLLKKGLWSGSAATMESPGTYKARYRNDGG